MIEVKRFTHISNTPVTVSVQNIDGPLINYVCRFLGEKYGIVIPLDCDWCYAPGEITLTFKRISESIVIVDIDVEDVNTIYEEIFVI